MYPFRVLSDDFAALVFLLNYDERLEGFLALFDLIALFEPSVVRQTITFRIVIVRVFFAPASENLLADEIRCNLGTLPGGNDVFHTNKKHGRMKRPWLTVYAVSDKPRNKRLIACFSQGGDLLLPLRKKS